MRMTPARLAIAARLELLIGFVAIVIALGAVEWRLGLFVFGALILASNWRELR